MVGLFCTRGSPVPCPKRLLYSCLGFVLFMSVFICSIYGCLRALLIGAPLMLYHGLSIFCGLMSAVDHVFVAFFRRKSSCRSGGGAEMVLDCHWGTSPGPRGKSPPLIPLFSPYTAL